MIQLNHIGIAVSDNSPVAKLLSILGISMTHAEDIPAQRVKTHFFPVAGETQIELLEPTDSNGVVAQFIRKRGPGVHHLSFLVEQGELEPLMNRLRNEGYRLVYSVPQVGANQMRVNFVHPASAGGVLVEIMEPR